MAWNAASQITSAAKSNNAYAYTDRYNVNRGYSANGLNQYTLAGAVSHAYDARGNLTASGTSSYTYSKFNELKTGPNGAALSYDGLGRLVQYDAPGSTRFSYAGPMMLAEHSSANALLRRYVPGPGALAGGDEMVVWYEGAGTADKRWLLGDERGSVVAVADASGAAIAINRYDEWGVPADGQTSTPNLGRFQYTGQAWLPELGLYNYKARMYSATLGRFMQTDPIGYGDGLNWYAYVGNDPVNKVDPSGTCTSYDGWGTVDGSLACEIVVNGGYKKDHPVVQVTGTELIWLYLPTALQFGGSGSVLALPQSAKPKSPCEQAMEEPGMVETESLNFTAIVGGGITGSWGTFHNTRTGTTGNYFTLGGGAGVDVGPSATGGQYRSVGDLSGGAANLSGTFVALTGSLSWNLKNLDFVGGALGIAPPSKAVSGTLTGTKLYGCKIGG